MHASLSAQAFMQGASPMQASKRRSTGGATAPYAHPDAMAEEDLWQGIVHMLQAAKRKLGAHAHTSSLSLVFHVYFRTPSF